MVALLPFHRSETGIALMAGYGFFGGGYDLSFKDPWPFNPRVDQHTASPAVQDGEG
jgi:hypothetical protein